MENLQGTDRIAEIFNGRTIFITGGTGFLGKALIDKLLRATEVKKIYILVRSKKGKSPSERLNEMFSNVLFRTLRKMKPNATGKCQLIEGDVTQPELGISKADNEILKKEVDFIFHSAATTRFDESISNSLKMNTRGTKYVLDLAEECKNLKLLIHVSTAYSFPKEKVTLEREYKAPANPHDVLPSINWIKDEAMHELTKILLGDVPNSYTLSKSLAEALVYEKVGNIPVIICRPAVVIPSFQDPEPGWINNFQGPIGLFVGCGKGVLRSMYMDSKSHANFVPVDCCVAALLVMPWYYLTTRDAPYIYNLCIPESDIVISWEEIIEAGKDVINNRVPFNGILWYPGGAMTKSKIYHKINFFLFQLIPAIFIDLLLFVLGYKPILYDIQRRIEKGGDMFEFYTGKSWKFSTKNIEHVRTKLNATEKKIYTLQSDNMDIKGYLENCILGARRNILKETDDMLPAAKRNMKFMFVLDRICKIMFFVILGYYVYKLLNYIF